MEELFVLTFICIRIAVRKGHDKTLWEPFLTIPSQMGTGKEVIMEILIVNEKYPKNKRFGQKDPITNYQILEHFLNHSK